MSRLAYVAAAFLMLAPVSAMAKTFPVPGDDPIATISIPDSWEPKTYDGGVAATSSDTKVYIAAESVEADDVKKATKEGLEFFEKQGVTLDGESMKSKDTKINGLDGFDITFSGKDKDGPTQVGLTLVQTNAKGKFLMLYFWGSEEGLSANLTDMKAISDSIQATK